jgi:ABC-2 type transport system ATP-binding protein
VECCRLPGGGSAGVPGLDPRRDGRELHRRAGLMLQQGGFYPAMTPAEALRLFASFYDKPLDPGAALDLVGLGDAAGTRYRLLSGGQKQRLSLAVALIGRPELVFLDEPTAGMDPQARRATWEIVRDLRARGTTVVLTTHLIDEAERLSDRVAIIDRGRLVALGSPGELTSGASSEQVVLSVAARLDPMELAALPAARDAREVRPGEYVLRTDAPADLLVELATWLRARSILPRELRVGHGTLEDVFLRLTGRRLED